MITATRTSHALVYRRHGQMRPIAVYAILSGTSIGTTSIGTMHIVDRPDPLAGLVAYAWLDPEFRGRGIASAMHAAVAGVVGALILDRSVAMDHPDADLLSDSVSDAEYRTWDRMLRSGDWHMRFRGPRLIEATLMTSEVRV